MTRDQGGEAEGEAPVDWPSAAARRRAAAFLDLWERHVSEHVRRGPAGDEPATHEMYAGRADEP